MLLNQLIDQKIELIKSNHIDEFKTQMSQYSPKEFKEIINSSGSCDDYLIHVAVTQKNLHLIKWLLENGANPMLKSSWGNNTLDLAIKYDFDEAIQLLNEYKPIIKIETEEVFVNKDSLDNDNEYLENSHEQVSSPAKPTSNTQKKIASTASINHATDEIRKVKNTNKLLKALLISNIFTAVIAIGSLYFSYQAMNSADSASYDARDAADSANYIKRWGVDCN